VATKLKNLKIRKVDFVDEGANPDADIKLFKRKDQGSDVQADSDNGENRSGSILKKLLGFIGKAAGMEQDEIDSAVDEIQKSDSMSFNEKINEVRNRNIADEMWDICYALQSSLCSILNDEELDSAGAATAMQESLDEFYAVVKESIAKWSNGKAASIVSKKNGEVSEAELDIMKSAVVRLNEVIKKAESDAELMEESKENGPNNNILKGEKEEMGLKIDKSKMTEAEKAFYESIEKRYGVDDGGSPSAGAASVISVPDVLAPEPSVIKSAAQANIEAEQTQQADDPDNIYKGLHPAVKAELEGLKKFREESENKELAEVAKKYTIIGKKEEELVPLLKSLKAAGGTAYNDMIAVLNQAVETVEKSGVFSEIGKSGHGSNENSAEAKVSGIAKKYMDDDPALSYQDAVAKAWENNPDLLDEYDEQEGF
jgi:hypothetical protein